MFAEARKFDEEFPEKRGFRVKTFRLCMLVVFAFASGMVLERFGAIMSGFSPETEQLAQENAGVQNLNDTLPTESKQLEEEVQKRAAYLASLVDDVKRLDRTSKIGTDEISSRNKARGIKVPMGGGESRGRSHAYYKFGGGKFEGISAKTPLVSSEQSNATIELSPLLQIDANLAKFSSTPIGYPVIGEITSGFGYRDSPFVSARRLHEGVDISVDPRTPVVSTADGIVTLAGPKSGYGNTVIIRHKDGIETLYAHLASVTVSEGMRICRGQRLGYVGMTGHTTGPHLHYEVRVNGVARNPMRFIDLGPAVTALAELPLLTENHLG